MIYLLTKTIKKTGVQHPPTAIFKTSKLKKMTNLTIKKTGYNNYTLITSFYNKTISMHSTDSKLIDAIEDGCEKSKKLAIKKIRDYVKSI
jgi:hypothetical protein